MITIKIAIANDMLTTFTAFAPKLGLTMPVKPEPMTGGGAWSVTVAHELFPPEWSGQTGELRFTRVGTKGVLVEASVAERPERLILGTVDEALTMPKQTKPQPMGTRGVLYVVWGAMVDHPAFKRSVDSLREHHPKIPIEVKLLPAHSTRLEKSRALDFSPYDTTLLLDADTVVMGNLDYGFERAERHHIACTINANPWARRYPSVKGDLVEYATGVLFFTRKATGLFERWKNLCQSMDSHAVEPSGTKPATDQLGFALAAAQLDFNPFVLPCNWNLRPSIHRAWCGPVKVWHDAEGVPPQVLKVNSGAAAFECFKMFDARTRSGPTTA